MPYCPSLTPRVCDPKGLTPRVLTVADYYVEGRKAWFRLHEKGGKRHEVPAHHNAADYVDAYIAAAGIAEERKSPLFRTIDRHRR